MQGSSLAELEDDLRPVVRALNQSLDAPARRVPAAPPALNSSFHMILLTENFSLSHDSASKYMSCKLRVCWRQRGTRSNSLSMQP